MPGYYKLLIIGNPYDAQLVKFVRYLKQENPSSEIDLFGLLQKGKTISSTCTECVGSLYLLGLDSFISRIRGLRTIVGIFRIRRFFHRTVSRRHYDIINIHYPIYYHAFILSDMKRISNKIVLTPWGSDVYRISKLEQRILKRLYDASDIVTGNGLRFSRDFMRIYDVPQAKFRRLCLGGDGIDYYKINRDKYDTCTAKKLLGIDGYYVITCGYNGSPAQRHQRIVEAVYDAKDKLPSKLMLLFPFTYAGSKEYRETIKNKVRELGLMAYYCEQYLDLQNLLVLRQATDMFIHVQKTDANNGSLKAYLWLDKNVINGAWLEYEDVEVGGYKPYYLTPSLEELSDTIIKAYKEGPIRVTDETKKVIEHYGYRYLAPKWNELFESLV